MPLRDPGRARLTLGLLLLTPLPALHGQQRDSLPLLGDSIQVTHLPTLEASADRVRRFVRQPLADDDGIRIVRGKKAEAIQLDRADLNAAQNSVRQLFGRTPGVMVWEQDPAGIQAGVSVRGLSPNRSWEFNTRANGIDIASDPFGYPEAYFTPPFEALERVEVVRGAASLQYGPQFGGLLNYVYRQGPADRAFSASAAQTGGSFGFYGAHATVGGTVGRVSYTSFFNYRRGNGARPGNAFEQYTGYAAVAVRLPGRGRLEASVTRMDYDLRQPGGLTEAQFTAEPYQSLRRRDWFGTPWTIPALHWNQPLGVATRLDVRAFGLLGERNSVGLTTSPLISDSLLNPRRVDQDVYRNAGLEARVRHGAGAHALAGGVRVSRGGTDRRRGRGSDGEAFDMAILGDPQLDLTFRNTNLAAFAEAELALGPAVRVTPGLRVERLVTTGGGSFTAAQRGFEATGPRLAVDQRAGETVLLGGLGVSVRASRGVELYGNLTQNWRPVLFSDQFPNTLVDVDPALRSSRGWSADAGVRGALGDLVAWDVGGFLLGYGDRVGTLNRAQLGADSLRFPNGLRTNVADSRHYGLEAYAEADLLGLGGLGGAGRGLLFLSGSHTTARYRGGSVDGRQVEFAPTWIVRTGITYEAPRVVSLTAQLSHVSSSFSDASNTVQQADGLQGRIPAYTVVDLSARARVRRGLSLQASVTNLLDRAYFTRRATGYPGPGIIPAEPRLVTAGLALTY